MKCLANREAFRISIIYASIKKEHLQRTIKENIVFKRENPVQNKYKRNITSLHFEAFE